MYTGHLRCLTNETVVKCRLGRRESVTRRVRISGAIYHYRSARMLVNRHHYCNKYMRYAKCPCRSWRSLGFYRRSSLLYKTSHVTAGNKYTGNLPNVWANTSSVIFHRCIVDPVISRDKIGVSPGAVELSSALQALHRLDISLGHANPVFRLIQRAFTLFVYVSSAPRRPRA